MLFFIKHAFTKKDSIAHLLYYIHLLFKYNTLSTIIKVLFNLDPALPSLDNYYCQSNYFLNKVIRRWKDWALKVYISS